MTPADRKPFLETIVGFAELKGKQLSAPAMELYWRSMQHWSLADFRAAAEQLVRTSEFMPTPKDFEDLRKAGRKTAGEAWIQVLEYARRGYNANSPSAPGGPDDPIARRAVAALGGYGAIAMSDTSKTSFLERRFCEHFEQMQDVEETREAVPEIAFDGRTALSGPSGVRNLLGKFTERADS